MEISDGVIVRRRGRGHQDVHSRSHHLRILEGWRKQIVRCDQTLEAFDNVPYHMLVRILFASRQTTTFVIIWSADVRASLAFRQSEWSAPFLNAQPTEPSAYSIREAKMNGVHDLVRQSKRLRVSRRSVWVCAMKFLFGEYQGVQRMGFVFLLSGERVNTRMASTFSFHLFLCPSDGFFPTSTEYICTPGRFIFTIFFLSLPYCRKDWLSKTAFKPGCNNKREEIWLEKTRLTVNRNFPLEKETGARMTVISSKTNIWSVNSK